MSQGAMTQARVEQLLLQLHYYYSRLLLGTPAPLLLHRSPNSAAHSLTGDSDGPGKEGKLQGCCRNAQKVPSRRF